MPGYEETLTEVEMATSSSIRTNRAAPPDDGDCTGLDRYLINAQGARGVYAAS